MLALYILKLVRILRFSTQRYTTEIFLAIDLNFLKTSFFWTLIMTIHGWLSFKCNEIRVIVYRIWSKLKLVQEIIWDWYVNGNHFNMTTSNDPIHRVLWNVELIAMCIVVGPISVTNQHNIYRFLNRTKMVDILLSVQRPTSHTKMVNENENIKMKWSL